MIEILVIAIFTFTASNIATSHPSKVILADSGKKSAIVIHTKEKDLVIDKPNTYVEISESENIKIKKISDSEIYSKFKDVIEYTPKKPISILLYFKKAKNELTEESEKKISTILKEIADRKMVDISIIGHTDTVGSNEMNAKLSLRRAELIKRLLLDKKIKYHSLKIDSYGENDLLIQTEDNVSEPKNRRVEVFIKWKAS